MSERNHHLNERNQKLESAYPSDQVQVLVFTEVPNAGESFIILDNEKEAKKYIINGWAANELSFV